jgi:hypothetical protein
MRAASERGQATPEWLGVVLVVVLAFSAMVAVGATVPGAEVARTLAGKLVCVVDLGADCDGETSVLVATYGHEVADLVAEHTPLLEYEEGMLALPIDWRECREAECTQGVESGEATKTNTGLAVTLFSHVVDCRSPERPLPPEANCDSEAAGSLYVQYWAYYPHSQTPPFGKLSFHPDDWESFQVRVGPEGAQERASSHNGYNGAGGDPLNDPAFTPKKEAWTDASGIYAISSRSHAGRVGSPPARSTDGLIAGRYPVPTPHRWTRPRDIRVIPIESIRSEWDAYVGSKKHLPAWLKDVYLDPEATGTGG